MPYVVKTPEYDRKYQLSPVPATPPSATQAEEAPPAVTGASEEAPPVAMPDWNAALAKLEAADKPGAASGRRKSIRRGGGAEGVRSKRPKTATFEEWGTSNIMEKLEMLKAKIAALDEKVQEKTSERVPRRARR